MVAGVFAGSLVTALATGRFHWKAIQSPRHMLRSDRRRGADGSGRRDGLWLLDRAGLTGLSTLALASFVAVAGILLGTARACAACCACSRWSRRRTRVRPAEREVARRITSR
jgi:hypothetical protein